MIAALLYGVFIVVSHLQNVECASSFKFNIGGLFNNDTHDTSKIAYKNFVKKNDYWVGQILDLAVRDSYTTALQVCDGTSDTPIVALIDARPTAGICDTTCLLCNSLQIPHLSLGWQPPDSLAGAPFTFSYHPPPETISKAYATLIKDFQWDRFSILYEDEDGLVRLQEIYNTWPNNQEAIVYRQLDPEGDNREIFKYIFKVAHLSHHVLDCHVNHIDKYMDEIVDVENSTQYQSFILTSLDAYKLNFRNKPNLLANVSTLHLTAYNEMEWRDVHMDAFTIPVETSLVADAIHHLDKAIRNFIENNSGPPQLPPSLCFQESGNKYTETAWPHGYELMDSLKTTSIKGFTGNIEFDEEGKRINFVLYYSKLTNESQFMYAGQWDSKTDIISKDDEVKDRSLVGSNRAIKVVSRVGRPYFDIDKENGTFRGFAVDLIHAVFARINNTTNLNLKYEFYRVAGDKYGNPIAGTKKWDGLIGDLLEHSADMAVCDLTITSERNSVVDFSTPFMTLGISMLFKKSERVEPNKFSFIQPLSVDVWLYLGTAYIIVSYMMLISARMCQGDWVNPHPCNRNPETLQNIWDLYNCMWLTMGAIMTQGCDILPRSLGSRWVTGFWWFFALILTSSYTANMSAFISNNRRNFDVKDVHDLAKQTKVSYGAVYNASTFKFFKNSNESVHKKIWSVMESARPTVFTSNNDEGRDRVLRSKGTYAFFMESTAIEYYTQRNCSLKMVGSTLDSKEYGIAMPKNFIYKSHVDSAILYLQEHGKLEELRRKWWVIEDNESNCALSEAEEGSTRPLQMENTSGIFLVLGLGGIIGLFVAIIDFMMHARKIAVNEKVTVKEAMKREWKASLNPRTLHKMAVPNRESPHTSNRTPSPLRERSGSRAVSVLRAATSFINFDEIY